MLQYKQQRKTIRLLRNRTCKDHPYRRLPGKAHWRKSRPLKTRGTHEIVEFLADKWAKELHYKLMKELWAFTDNHISVRFEYEWQHSQNGQWFRTHGNEHWEFDSDGYMQRRDMSANDIPISASDRRL